MKFGTYLTVFSILAGVAYGVLFSYTYPLVQITGGLVTLSAVLGLATCLLVVGIWKSFGKIVHVVNIGKIKGEKIAKKKRTKVKKREVQDKRLKSRQVEPG